MDAASNDLRRPLGLERGSRRGSRWRFPVARLFALLVLLCVGAVAGYVALVDDPLGGEPHAIVAIEDRSRAGEAMSGPRAASPAAIQAVPSETRGRTSATAAEVESVSGVSVVRPDGTGAPASVVIRVPEPPVIRLNPAPDSRLVERTRYGLLPRIGADGARPSSVYARPAGQLPGGARPVARIAILVTGLGISQTATAEAITRLPAEVTLAFAPYGSDLERHVARARDDGHEVMLQVPMEPFDYPDNDPGPHTLTTQAGTQDNVNRLHWVMGRFSGYTGLVNFMGAKLTATETALAPILREIGQRGLVFLDDGSSSRSLVATVGPTVQATTARADLVIDGVPRPELIDKELVRLEERARERGFAVGTASALPLTVERLARWSRTLEAKGILLVPVSGAFRSESR